MEGPLHPPPSAWCIHMYFGSNSLGPCLKHVFPVMHETLNIPFEICSKEYTYIYMYGKRTDVVVLDTTETVHHSGPN